MLTLRRATVADVPVILALIRELAIYEREPDAVVATEADLVRDGFGDHPAFFVHLAEETREHGARETIGLAFWFHSYSTWVGRRCLYLEDLFVKPAHRGKGVGLALMKALAAEAIATGCRRFVWQVLDWNTPAVAFYERLGAHVLPEWQTVRLDGEALARLAHGAPPCAPPEGAGVVHSDGGGST